MKTILISCIAVMNLLSDQIHSFKLQLNTSRNWEVSKKTFIDQLKDNEYIIIAFKKVHCFGSDSSYKVLKIFMSSGEYYASYKGNEKKISKEKVQYIKGFENQLDSVSNIYKCTNDERYIVRYKNRIKNKSDNSCSWHGFDDLIAKLFD